MAAINEEVIHEYPSIGKYRVQILEKKKEGTTITSIDIREYVSAEKFEGFTRRGIRLTSLDGINQLRDALADMISRGWFEEEA